MERIVIEVEKKVAEAWRKLPASKKRKIGRKAGRKIDSELKDKKADPLIYFNKLREKMKERGLTQEILDEILNEGK